MSEEVSVVQHHGNTTRCDLSPYQKPSRDLLQVGHTRVFQAISTGVHLGNIIALDVTKIIEVIWHRVLCIFGSSDNTTLLVKGQDGSATSHYLNHRQILDLDIEAASRKVGIESQYEHADAIYRCHEVKNSDATAGHSLEFFYKEAQTVEIGISFDCEVYNEESLMSLLEVAAHLLTQVDSNPSLPIRELNTVPPTQTAMMESWNKTDGEFPDKLRLEHLFELAVAGSADDKIAVKHGLQTLTYHELNNTANQVARCLRGQFCVTPGQLVGLLVDKSKHCIIFLLALWKCGAAAVAIDPAYPDKRAKFSITDTGLCLVLTTSAYVHRMQDISQELDQTLEIISLDDIYRASSKLPSDNCNYEFSNTDLAYISYTSGTTGTPKGIKKKHISLVNSITDLSEKYEVKRSQEENIVLFSTYVFEPFYRQMLMALINGHCLHIVEDELKLDAIKFSQFLEEEKITYLNGTPSILQEYDYSKCPQLKRLILVGEQLTTIRYETLREKFSGKIICEYGFTESAFVTLLKHFGTEDKRVDTSLGKPVRNVKCYILDRNLSPLPVGVIGTLFVGGAGVSSGYLNRESLTKERFLPNPYQSEQDAEMGMNSLLYNTGDLVSYTRHGEIRFHGRSDFQIKLRGIRIEPGEIETVLSSHHMVERCVVLVRGNGSDDEAARVLIAFCTAQNSMILKETDLISFLGDSLPRYMVPSRIVQVNRIPVNVNGKVDMKALPDIPLFTRNTPVDISVSEIERAFASIWSKILGVEANLVPSDADFFILGGNSIRCVQAISQIHQQLGLHCSVDDFFRLKKLDLIVQEIINRDVRQDESEIEVKTNTDSNLTKGYFLANSMQQSMAYQSMKGESSNGVYTMQSLHEVSTIIEPNLFKHALVLAQQRFPTLRSKFQLGEVSYHMVIDKESTFTYHHHDLSTDRDFEHHVQELLQKDRKQPYDIFQSGLFRVHLISVPEHKSIILFSCHHIILDGWSLPKMFEFIFDSYLKLLNRQNAVYLIDSSYQEALNFLENRVLSDLKEDTQFWSSELDKLQDRCQLAGLLLPDKKKTQLSTYNKVEAQAEDEICISSSANLHDYCRDHGFTLNSVLQFVWHQVLAAYGNAKQTVVGTTFSGRNIPVNGIQDTVGMMINTLPVIVEHDHVGSQSVISAIAKIQDTINAVNQRAHCWMAKLPTDNFKHELFDSLFIFDVYPCNTVSYRRDSFIVKKVFNYDKLDFPLVAVASGEEWVKFKLLYAKEIFDPVCMRNMLELVDFLVTQIVLHESIEIDALDLVTPTQKQLIDKFNRTDVKYPLNLCLHEIFEMEVERVAEKKAVIYREISLTYRELNNLANRLAFILKNDHGLSLGDKVALFQEKSELLIASILAVWKCGAAFVPIGVDYPEERVEYIIQDSYSKIVLTCSKEKERLSYLNTNSSCLILDVQEIPLQELERDIDNQHCQMSSDDLAYIIYTSGTTGKPKGVMVQHRGVANLKFAMEDLFELKKGTEVILSFSNYIFDHFVEQMNDAILTGQTLLILDDNLRYDKKGLHDYMRKNRVTYLSGTPTVVSQYNILNLPHLKRVDVVGEDLKEETFNKLRSQFSGLIINGYGPTEISITSHKRLYYMGDHRADKSIGHQISNSTTYIVNCRNQLLPIGAVGEMLIGGVGVTQGYLNNTQLTQEKFIPNKFTEDAEHSRMYATGDLVRWLPNGEIEYLGRVDQQVKIRGIRIELAEIESVIELHPSVDQAAVKPFGSSMKDLAAFVSLKSDCENLNEEDVKRHVSSKVPFSLIPSRIVFLEKLPITPSGKLNYKMLPKVEDIKESQTFIPNNEVEDKLASLWISVLSITPHALSSDLSFFQAGGDSLLIVHLISSIRDVFQTSLSVTDIMNNSTIPQQAGLILERKEKHLSTIGKLSPIDESARATPEQQNLLFIHERDENCNTYNIHLMYHLNPVVDAKLLDKALVMVMEQHSILRTVYRFSNEGFIQDVLPVGAVKNVLLYASAKSADEVDELLIRESKHVFSLDSNPPMRSLLIRNGSKFILSVVVHHIAFDGHSASLFEEELRNSYSLVIRGLSREQDNPVPSFSDFCRSEIIKSIPAPDGTNNASPPPTRLEPSVYSPESSDGCKISFGLNSEFLPTLGTISKENKVTLHCLLTAAFFKTLQNVTGQSMVSFASPFGTRTIDFECTIGFFVSMKEMYLDMNNYSDFPALLESVKDQIHTRLKEVNTHGGSRKPISIVFASQNEKNELEAGDLFMSRYELENGEFTPAKFDIYFEVVTGNKFRVNVTYKSSLYQSKNMKEFVDKFSNVLSSLVEEKSLNDQESMTLGSCFMATASQNERKIALIHGDEQLTYKELLIRSLQLSKCLHNNYHVQPGDFVGLYFEKNVGMIVSIIAVWMLGAAYVPIDIDQPRDRVKFQVSGADPKVLLCNRNCFKILESFLECPIFAIEDGQQQIINNVATSCEGGSADNIAYLMYTSGTSGRPKGVLVSQKNLLSFFKAITNTYFHEHQLNFSTVLFLSNYSFDFSIEQIMLSLFRGGTLVLPLDKGPVVFDSAFYDYVDRTGVDFMSGTPSHLTLCRLNSVKNLKVLLLAGERVSETHFKTFRDPFSGVIIQAYGTTETSVYNTYKIYRTFDEFKDSIGKPLPNSATIVLDEAMNKVSEGELYISGECVTRGYLNRPKETSDSFIYLNGSLVYKTGDRVKILSNGELRYMERIDSQMSVNGMRIEKGEIESHVLSWDTITQVHVMLHPKSSNLICYYVSESKVENFYLQAFLQEKLPEKMIPKRFIEIPIMPLTKNGKIDEKALLPYCNELEPPESIDSDYQSDTWNETEEKVRDVWSSVLDLHPTNIGLDDDFFMSGGDSIKSLHLVAELRRSFASKVSVKDVFTSRTIRKLSSVIDNRLQEKVIIKSTVDNSANVAEVSTCLLPIQKWFFAKQLQNRDSWNQCFAIRLPHNAVVEKIKYGVQQIIENHEVFRYRFTQSSDCWIQSLASEAYLNFHVIDATDMGDELLFNQLVSIQSSFNLEKGPLYAAVCIMREEYSLIWLSVHHLIVDTFSWEIIRNELRASYQQDHLRVSDNASVALTEWLSYSKQTVWSYHVQSHWKNMRNKVCKWNEDIRGILSPAPTSHFELQFQSPSALYNKYFSPYIVLLASLGKSLTSITGFSSNFVTLEGHGRESDDKDLSSIVGWFTSMFPVELSTKDSLLDSLSSTKDMMASMPQNGASYGLIHGYTDGFLPKFSFNFLGVMSKNNDHDWAITDEFGMSLFPLEEASNIDTLVDITAAVFEGNLKVQIASRLSEEITVNLTRSFESNMNSISEYLAANSLDRIAASHLLRPQDTYPGSESSFDSSSDGKVYSDNSLFRDDDSLEDDSYEMFISLEHQKLFVLPPGEGGGESYLNNIAPILQPHYSLYLFNNLYRDHGEPNTIPQLAELYSCHIQRIQRTGTVHLLGWSFGGVLAFEIAVNLTMKGFVVGNVFLIDPFFDVPTAYRDCNIPESSTVVDRINMTYRPAREKISEVLEKSEVRFVLFKMVKPIRNPASKQDSQFFSYYLKKQFNNLDMLIPVNSIQKHDIQDNHYTWVVNKAAVTKLCLKVIHHMTSWADTS